MLYFKELFDAAIIQIAYFPCEQGCTERFLGRNDKEEVRFRNKAQWECRVEQ